jgi:uncharacterized protein YbjT (DUF2867 family)
MTTHREKRAKQVIVVFGGTGQQGGAVVRALLERGEFAVRVPTRNMGSDAARALAARGVELVKADLLEPSSLRAAFEGAYGAFLVTNPWDPGQRQREFEIATAAVKAARAAGVQHLIWSTLPNAAELTGGRQKVPHFSSKAQVDAVVGAAGFPRHTFVQPPFYFQNLVGVASPQPLPDGGRGWAVPMNPAAPVIHAGDVNDLGPVVAAAFSARDKIPDGSYLAVCGGVYSWNDFVGALNSLGHDLKVKQVPAKVFDDFFPGASEVREMYEYFEAATYFGPEREKHIAAAHELVPGGFVKFVDWARRNMAPKPQ